MKMTKPFFVTAVLICMSFIYVAMAKPAEEKPGARLDVLEEQVADLQAELARVSPDADLTGAIYCIFGQGIWLFADPGVSADITADPFTARLDFTSSTELTITRMSDPFAWISIPSYTMHDSEDLGSETATYAVVGNLLTLTVSENGESETISFIMTPDAQVFASGFAERGSDGTVQSWETGMIVGVQAASCD